MSMTKPVMSPCVSNLSVEPQPSSQGKAPIPQKH